MKAIRITLHPLSAISGAAMCALVVYTSSMQSSADGMQPLWTRQLVANDDDSDENPPEIGILSLPPVSIDSLPPFRIDGSLPHPRNWVVVPPGTTYTVPEGKWFVITALGSTIAGAGSIVLQIDGEYVLKSSTNITHEPTSTVPVPPGLVAPAGSTVNTTNGVEGQIWGYLVNE